MLGMVFTEFLEMVEVTFSAETVDRLLSDCNGELATGGAYTAVGNYSHDEMMVLVSRLSEMTGIPVSDLIYRSGRHLFQRFRNRYPNFFKDIDGAFPFLESVHGHIHVEVRKLYGEAKVPSLQCRRDSADRMTVVYCSDRPFAKLAHGLIEGCIAHYEDATEVEVLAMAADGKTATFALDRRARMPGAAGTADADLRR
ncbi:MAG: heme NO-binding domain-containing protein [Rhizobiaceae bacterium]|nr:heme NO-binding domain-containing protein [Rhizobiaceae bacterium]